MTRFVSKIEMGLPSCAFVAESQPSLIQSRVLVVLGFSIITRRNLTVPIVIYEIGVLDIRMLRHYGKALLRVITAPFTGTSTVSILLWHLCPPRTKSGCVPRTFNISPYVIYSPCPVVFLRSSFPTYFHWQPKRRIPKHLPPVTDIVSVNCPNNGNIEIIPADNRADISKKMNIDEVHINGRRYRIPERVVVLDFWDKLHRLNRPSYVFFWFRNFRKIRMVSDISSYNTGKHRLEYFPACHHL